MSAVRAVGTCGLATLLVSLVLAFPAAVQGSELVMQDTDVAEYPVVRMSVALSSDLVPKTGTPDFAVRENGIEVQELKVQAAAGERPPIDVVLLIDTSGSMQGKPLSGAKRAAQDFVNTMRAEDRVALVSFSSEPRAVVSFTSDVGELTRGIQSLEAKGETALHDGLIQAAKTLEGGDREHYIVVLSDGGDTTSINTLDAALDAVSKVKAPVYAVALASPEYDPAALKALATRSGGKLVSVKDADSLSSIFKDIATELQNLFIIEYTSARPSTKDLEIELTVTNGDAEGGLVAAIPNPLYAQGVLPDTDLLSPSPASDTLVLLLAAMIALALGLAVYALGSLLTPKPSPIDQLKAYEQYQVGSLDEDQVASRGSRSRVMDAVAYVAERQGFTGLVRSNLEKAGLPLRANEYIFLHLLTTIVAGSITQLLSGRVLVSAGVVALVVLTPIVVLRLKISRRRAAFEEQLPDVLSLIAGSLRAGWGIQQSIELVVEEISDPASGEFRRVQSEARFGLPLEQALGRMAERLDSEDFRWTVSAIAIQREVGGNLAEVLDLVATTIRQRAELRRHVGSLTAESRFSMVVLAVLPVFLLGALLVINPGYASVLVSTPVGITALLVGLILLAVGVFWISRLTKVEV